MSGETDLSTSQGAVPRRGHGCLTATILFVVAGAGLVVALLRVDGEQARSIATVWMARTLPVGAIVGSTLGTDIWMEELSEAPAERGAQDL